MSQSLVIASCCCQGGFACAEWSACIPQRVRLRFSRVIVSKIVIGGLTRTQNTQSVECDLECEFYTTQSSLGMRSVVGGSWSYFYEQIENAVPRFNVFDPDPNCSVPCGTQFFCRRYAEQASGSFDNVTSEALIVCTYPCGVPGIPGDAAYTKVQVNISGPATWSETYGTNQICPNAGTPAIFGQTQIGLTMIATDSEPRCIKDWSSWVLDIAPGTSFQVIVPVCVDPGLGFFCTFPNVQTVVPRQSWNVSSCPELICEDFVCIGPDPADPFGTVILNECGCASLFPGSYSNTAGERIRTYEEEVSSDVSIVVLIP